jgi:DNA-directed RNA polymerase sigma subunit (sigma70/sigma32)
MPGHLLVDAVMTDGSWDWINDFPVLTREQEMEMGALAATGDDDARWKLVLHNLKFAVWYMTRHFPSVSGDDLHDAAMDAMFEAAKRYDPDRGMFITYATWWLFREGHVRFAKLPAGIHCGSRKLRLEWITAHGGGKSGVCSIGSVREPCAPGDPEAVPEHFPIDPFLGGLDDRERKVAKALFGFGQEPVPMLDIAKQWGVSKQRIHQIMQGILDRLRVDDRFTSELRDFVEIQQREESQREGGLILP